MPAAPRQRVLIADDQPLIRWALGRILQTLGFEPVFAASRQDALARAAESGFELAFVADPFEERDSACVVQALRDRGTRRVIVLAESARASEPATAAWLIVVQKPFSLDAVVNAVGAPRRGAG
ncbi:MAG TPA: hypothetical protein VK886_14120 [Vicinamibacterales bacterium]|nr:hypothetical protein [Vicinamibacterales bacterium]